MGEQERSSLVRCILALQSQLGMYQVWRVEGVRSRE
jgi:hypothetical protein